MCINDGPPFPLREVVSNDSPSVPPPGGGVSGARYLRTYAAYVLKTTVATTISSTTPCLFQLRGSQYPEGVIGLASSNSHMTS